MVGHGWLGGPDVRRRAFALGSLTVLALLLHAVLLGGVDWSSAGVQAPLAAQKPMQVRVVETEPTVAAVADASLAQDLVLAAVEPPRADRRKPHAERPAAPVGDLRRRNAQAAPRIAGGK